MAQAVVAAAAAVLGPAGAAIAGPQFGWAAWRSQVEQKRMRTYLTELAGRIVDIEGRGVDLRRALDDPNAMEWFSDTIDAVRRVRGQEKLGLLAAIAAGTLSLESVGKGDLSDHLWTIVSELSYEEIVTLHTLWELAQSQRGGLTAEQIASQINLDQGVIAAILVRLQGRGLIDEWLSIVAGENSENISDTYLDRGDYGPTELTTKLFAVVERGGWHTAGLPKSE